MKKTFFLCIGLLALVSCGDQSNKTNEDLSQQSVSKTDALSNYDKQAEPVNGVQNFYKSFASEFNVDNHSNNENQVKILLSFVVETDGSFNEIKVLKSSSEDLANEAIEILKSMPKWNPAELDGKPVRSLYTLPITINLS